METLEELRDEASGIVLQVGDMIFDMRTKSRGFLIKRERRIFLEDEVYIWNIYWFYQNKDIQFNNVDFMEEEGLKLSILIGTMELYSINQGE
jgi:hypothetical protein